MIIKRERNRGQGCNPEMGTWRQKCTDLQNLAQPQASLKHSKAAAKIKDVCSRVVLNQHCSCECYN